MTTQRHDVDGPGPIESTEPVTDEHYSRHRDQYLQQHDQGGDPLAFQTQSQGADPYFAGERAGVQRSSGIETGGQLPVDYGAAQGHSQATGSGSYPEPTFAERGEQRWDRSGEGGQYGSMPGQSDPSSVARADTVPESTGGTATPFHDSPAESTTTDATLTETSTAHPDSTAGSPHEESLIAGHDLTGLRSRWNDVQAGFVDDPRECVHRADKLVTDVLDSVTTRLSQARSGLEEQWARGEQVSTEDLRLALKRYREFFDRLLAV